VLVLLDARFGIKETDEPVLRLLDEAAVSFQAVLTKADLVEEAALGELLSRLAAQLARHAAAHPVIHITSAERGVGIAALRGALATLAAERGPR
jgi:GTP-binding protein